MKQQTASVPAPQAARSGNRYDLGEWAGAFGVAMIAAGLYYKTPVPVQPMKAIGAVAATQAAQTAIITAGHTRFGARTGGAVVILGVIVCAIGLLFSDSVSTLLKIFPLPVLGVVLFLTGAQLALGSCDFSKQKHERFATLVTAGCSVWNVGLGCALGWLLLAALRRGYVKL